MFGAANFLISQQACFIGLGVNLCIAWRWLLSQKWTINGKPSSRTLTFPLFLFLKGLVILYNGWVFKRSKGLSSYNATNNGIVGVKFNVRVDQSLLTIQSNGNDMGMIAFHVKVRLACVPVSAAHCQYISEVLFLYEQNQLSCVVVTPLLRVSMVINIIQKKNTKSMFLACDQKG